MHTHIHAYIYLHTRTHTYTYIHTQVFLEKLYMPSTWKVIYDRKVDAHQPPPPHTHPEDKPNPNLHMPRAFLAAATRARKQMRKEKRAASAVAAASGGGGGGGGEPSAADGFAHTHTHTTSHTPSRPAQSSKGAPAERGSGEDRQGPYAPYHFKSPFHDPSKDEELLLLAGNPTPPTLTHTQMLDLQQGKGVFRPVQEEDTHTHIDADAADGATHTHSTPKHTPTPLSAPPPRATAVPDLPASMWIPSLHRCVCV
jgi:hypothetical protein